MEKHDIAQNIDLADVLLKEEKYTEAISLLEKIYQSHPNEESVLLRLAWSFWDSGDKTGSLHYWQILLDRELQRQVFTGFAYDELVRIYKQENRIEDLVALCEKAARVQPEDIGILEELGNAYLLSAQNSKACDVFRKLTLLENDNPSYFRHLGESLMAAEDFSSAEEAFREAGRIDPVEADRYLFQASALFVKKGRFEAAKTLLEECLTIAPSNSLYYCFMGDLLIMLKQPDQALTAYETACCHNFASAGAYYNRLGNSFMKAGFFQNAVNAFEKALSLDPFIPCRDNLAMSRRASGQNA